MIKWAVYDGNNLADCYNYDVHHSWNCAVFDSKEAAVEYACKWLGYAWGGVDKDGKPLIPYELFETGYSLYANTIKIVKQYSQQ